jgi:hypothetical protein
VVQPKAALHSFFCFNLLGNINDLMILRSLLSVGTLLVVLTSCSNQPMEEERVNYWDRFDGSTHLKPEISRSEFETLKDWDFGWLLLEPIDKSQGEEHEIELAKSFSPGQKALYFFWYLDGQVTNGGFVQFYYNGYDRFLPPIKQGLELIGDMAMLQLVTEADAYYWKNKAVFLKYESWSDYERLVNELPEFDGLDTEYYQLHDKTMGLIEQHARLHPEQFAELH